MNTFSTKEALAFGWKTTKENFWFLAGLLVITVVVGNLPSFIAGMINLKEGVGMGFMSVISWLLQFFLQMGTMVILLRIVDGQKLTYTDLWSQKNLYFIYLVASLLVSVATFVGIILLIVPGIMIGLALMFYGYFVIDKKLGIIESIQMSIAATKGHRWQLFGFVLLCALLNIIGMLLLGVGLFFTMPTTMIASAYIYRKLANAMQPVPATPAPPAPVPASA